MIKRIFNLHYISCLTILVMTIYSCQPTQEKEMYVFELEKPQVKMDRFKSLIENLDKEILKNSQRDEEGNLLFYVDEKTSTYFEQNILTGKFSFNRGMNKYLGEFKPELPSETVSEEIAISFLKKYNLTPKSREELRLLHSGGLRADSPTGQGIIDKMRTLTYGRFLNGIPVIGSGSKIVIHIGDKGEVSGLIYKWREITESKKEPVKSEEMISQEEAKAIFNETIATEFGKGASATINKIDLIYYDGDGNYIQPAYGIESTVMIELSKDNVIKLPYLSIVTALKDPPEVINLREVSKDAIRLLNKIVDQKGQPGIKENTD